MKRESDEKQRVAAVIRDWRNAGLKEEQITTSLKAIYGIDSIEKFETCKREHYNEENYKSQKGKRDYDIKEDFNDKKYLKKQEIEYLKFQSRRKQESLNLKYIEELTRKESLEEQKANEKCAQEILMSDLKAREDKRRRLEKEQEEKAKCAICLDNFSLEDSFAFWDCVHVFHQACLEDYMIEEIKKKSFPIKCPCEECKKEINAIDIKHVLKTNPQYQQYFDEYSLKIFLESNPDKYQFCPTPDCGNAFSIDEKNSRIFCPKCGKDICIKCKTEWHENLTCEQNKAKADKEFLNLARKMGYQQCPQCNQIIERTEGCNNMVCSRCKTQFCYQCGRKGNAHFCFHLGSNNNNRGAGEVSVQNQGCSLM